MRACGVFIIDEATGEKHLHAAWFRIDPETNRAHDPGLFKLRLMEVARWAEREFALRELSNERQPHDKARAPERTRWKNPAASAPMCGRSAPPFSIASNRPTAARHSRPRSKNAASMLANGDRRDCFVVVDQEGGQHALNKKLTGQTLAETRARLADLDRSQLPGVEQAQAMQRERLAEAQPEPAAIPIKEPANQITQPPPMPERITRPEEWLVRGRYDELRGEHPKAQAAAEIASPAGRASPGMETAEPAVDQAAQGNDGLLRSLSTWFANFIDRLSRTHRDVTDAGRDCPAGADGRSGATASHPMKPTDRNRRLRIGASSAVRRNRKPIPALAAMMKLHMQPSARRQNELYRETERDRD